MARNLCNGAGVLVCRARYPTRALEFRTWSVCPVGEIRCHKFGEDRGA